MPLQSHDIKADRRDAGRWLALLREHSVPLLLPGSEGATPLPLRAAAATQGPSASGSGSTGAPADSVFYVGGPVWTLEWCPWAGKVEPEAQFLAVRAPRLRQLDALGPVGQCSMTWQVFVCEVPILSAGLCFVPYVRRAAWLCAPCCSFCYLRIRVSQVAARTRGRETTVIGSPLAGPALLQLWEVPRPSGNGGGSGGASGGLPHMVLGMAFPSGGVVWEAKWCPSAACSLPPADGCLPRCLSCGGLLSHCGTLHALAWQVWIRT